MRPPLPYTPEQEEALTRFLRTTRNVRERERARALLALGKGKRRTEIAEIFGINTGTLDLWKLNFRKQGIFGIQDKDYPGNHRKLTREQKEEIGRLIRKKTPRDLGLSEKRFWNVPLLRKLIKGKYRVVYDSVATYRKLFYTLEISCHKPARHNRNQDPHLVRRFRTKVKKRSGNIEGWAVWSW